MSSDETISIKVENLGKCYEIYSSPRDRLKQFVVPPVQRIFNLRQSKYYEDYWALSNISFEVRKGEAFGVVGRNGSGKSTLLQLITGTLEPTTGTISKHGRVAALLELGSGFNPEFSGKENVYLNAMLLGMTRDEVDNRFDQIAAFADIGAYLDQPVKTYSSGMLVRLAFAVQVQIEPDILIVDEALAVGDALFQKRCYNRIEKLLSDGVTLIFVSHDQESIRTLTHRAILLKQGQAVLTDTSSQVLLAYRKLLHEEESKYFSHLVADRTASSLNSSNKPIEKKADNVEGLSDKLSFGDRGVEVVHVQTYNKDGEVCAVFYPEELIRIRVECFSKIDTDHLNVGIRIRSREGIKIYSWGTLNQDIQIIAGLHQGELFWDQQIHRNKNFIVWLECACTLGTNLYEIQASVSHEDRPDYTAQRMLHWQDEAAFFQVLIRQNEYTFGGITDLRMNARWE